ncbi:MAG: prephenate dehydrogenase/arogenate dehydrogenase family protein [Nitrospirae bacterium]|nr:prephenate dehydrogenase/arogenate dehydrogenase family protein [Nitrospirota bacterium]
MIKFGRVAIIGVGLIGASLALALKKHGIADEVRGTGRQEGSLKKAVRFGVIDSYSLNRSEVVTGADLVVLATPVGCFRAVIEETKPFLKKGAIVTDVGSVKGRLARELEGLMPEGVSFVGGHPIAGSDRSGIDAASADLFAGAKCIITPTEQTPEDAVRRVTELWTALGAEVCFLSPEEHDLVFALVSHLPHLIAYALVNTVGDVNPDYIHYAGKGFKDTTRVALSSPELWRDICFKNKENLLSLVQRFQQSLTSMVDALEGNDSEGLEVLFDKAQRLRGKLL